MFTGIIEEIGRIKMVHRSGDGASMVIEAKEVLKDVKLGDSIATNGVCLTVNRFDATHFQVDIMAETIRNSNLKFLKEGSLVNLERALAVGDRLGGHIVSGHIDGVGTIHQFEKEDNAIWITIKAPANILKYIILRGSIAIDGVSLTVAYVDHECFKISMIPHTKDVTILIHKKVGEVVNLECDMMAKYIEKMMNVTMMENKPQKKDITMDLLKQNGFLS